MSFDQVSFFGASAGHPDLDYHLYINTNVMTSVNGTVSNCRFGVSTVNDIYWPIANIQARLLPGTSAVQVNKFAAGTATGLADTDFGNFSAISISGSYIVI